MRKSSLIRGVALHVDELEAIDAWRRQQPIRPSLSSSIRYLVAQGLEHQKRLPQRKVKAK